MFHPTHLCFPSWPARRASLTGTAILLALLATSACTRSNASAGAPQPAAQSSQPTPTQPTSAQPVQPPAGRAFELAELQQKADAGDPNAMYHLGRMYATGSGVEKDYVEAFDWYKRAAAAGNAEAMYSLGEAYEHGLGVRENVQTAVQWYDKAVLHGNKAANAALARLGETIEDHR
jgi:hypothetical protein